jgi:hypothetical protein
LLIWCGFAVISFDRVASALLSKRRASAAFK